jgi:hypothetical protein
MRAVLLTCWVIGALALAACDRATGNPTLAVAGRSSDLDAAFVAAFGAPAPVMRVVARNGEPVTLRYRPARLLDLGGRYALMSEARSDGCRGCRGALSVHYLTRAGNRFQVVGAWPEFSDGGSFGEPPAWRIRDDLFSGPALESDVAGAWRGCALGYVDLFELTPTGPVVRARRVLMYYDDETRGERSLRAVIRPEAKDRAFAVDYDGDGRRTVEYRPAGAVFVPVRAEPGLPSC